MPPIQPNTKHRIIQAGCSAITAKSFNGCGLKEILDDAGVPKGSFYHYFRSKEDLGVAVIEQSAREHVEYMRELLEQRDVPPLERIRRLFAELREYYAEQGLRRECIIPKLALEVAQLSEPMRLAIRYAYGRWAALLAKTLDEAKAAGELAADVDSERTANLLVNTWEGVTIRMQIEKSLDPLDQFLEDVLTRLLPKP